jgi:hypothetical protein
MASSISTAFNYSLSPAQVTHAALQIRAKFTENNLDMWNVLVRAEGRHFSAVGAADGLPRVVGYIAQHR